MRLGLLPSSNCNFCSCLFSRTHFSWPGLVQTLGVSWDDSQIVVVYDETVKAQSVAAGLEEGETLL